MEFIQNGQPSGEVGQILLNAGMDPCALRPYIGDDKDSNGNYYHYQTVMNKDGTTRAVRLQNATAVLRVDEWKEFDDVVVRVARERLKAVADVQAAGLVKTISSGMGKTILVTETQSDTNPAEVNMDGISESANDRTVYEPTFLPLPIIHKDFHFTARQIAVSRESSTPLDTEMIELATRKVAEEMEKQLIGVSDVADEFAYGSGIIYGYTNFPSAITRTITAPTASGWTAVTLLNEILSMIDDSRKAFHYGPWRLYIGTSWEKYLGADYTTGYPKSVRTRLMEIEGLTAITALDFLTGFDLVLVQMTSDVVREVNAMNITTLQWPTQGGMQINFKVMAIMVPQLRADQNGNTGIVYGSV